MFCPVILFTFNYKDAMNSPLRVFVKRSTALNDRPSIQRAMMVLANSRIIPERWNKINGINSPSGNCFKMYGSVDKTSCPFSHPYTAGNSKTM